MVKWPFQGLSDLQLGYKKVTLDHLVVDDYNWPVPWPSFGLAAHAAGQKSSKKTTERKTSTKLQAPVFTALQKIFKICSSKWSKKLWGFLMFLKFLHVSSIFFTVKRWIHFFGESFLRDTFFQLSFSILKLRFGSPRYPHSADRWFIKSYRVQRRSLGTLGWIDGKRTTKCGVQKLQDLQGGPRKGPKVTL